MKLEAEPFVVGLMTVSHLRRDPNALCSHPRRSVGIGAGEGRFKRATIQEMRPRTNPTVETRPTLHARVIARNSAPGNSP